jgi:hypothetical protein
MIACEDREVHALLGLLPKTSPLPLPPIRPPSAHIEAMRSTFHKVCALLQLDRKPGEPPRRCDRLRRLPEPNGPPIREDALKEPLNNKARLKSASHLQRRLQRLRQFLLRERLC